MSLAGGSGADSRDSALEQLMGVALPAEDEAVEVRGQTFLMKDGILRSQVLHSAAQQQTADAFGFKWQRRETYESQTMLARMRAWLEERYGRAAEMDWLSIGSQRPVLVDAGCGSAMSAIELFGDGLRRLRYVGVDVSTAVDTAAVRFTERELPGEFLQADLNELPFAAASVDAIFSEGALHHTDSPRHALLRLARLLKPGGLFLFYLYRRKGPIREFTDDYVREAIQRLDPAEAWRSLMSLTRLGEALGKLDVQVEVPEGIELLQIPAGKIDIQRLFYWHVFKAYYHPELSLEEMNHINFDWYAPRNAFRQSPEEIRSWCDEAGLEIQRERVEEAGVTIVARRREDTPPVP